MGGADPFSKAFRATTTIEDRRTRGEPCHWSATRGLCRIGRGTTKSKVSRVSQGISDSSKLFPVPDNPPLTFTHDDGRGGGDSQSVSGVMSGPQTVQSDSIKGRETNRRTLSPASCLVLSLEYSTHHRSLEMRSSDASESPQWKKLN